ncbi:snake venom 5'-nucleotidase-like [Tubulanus polymorphus]|uniref:snake venom 5'-nucleotidase-like n=1 Tax=Tubulanus polymorphus TaxID=672921 RepID=UPI003DA66FD2
MQNGRLYLVIVLFVVIQETFFCFNLTLIHTNDVHARFEETNDSGGSCTNDTDQKPCFGGVARRMTKIRELRSRYANSLLLDAGDQYQGTLWFYLYKGLATAHFMNLLKYDAMAFGNHEFDIGVDGLLPLVRNVSFPLLSCNIDASKEPKLNGAFRKSTHFLIDGEKIGVVGYTTSDTPQLSSPGPTLIFENEISTIQEEVNKLLSEGVNKIIAVGHAGIDVDLQIAEKVSGIDVIVGGHTNTFLYTGKAPSEEVPAGDYPHVVARKDGSIVLIVQDYAFGKYLGCLHVTFDEAGRLKDWSGNPILLDSSVPEDKFVLGEIRNWAEPLKNIGAEIIGKTHVFLEGSRSKCRLHECNTGNLITDAMIHQNIRYSDGSRWTNVSIAMWNGGGIRASINKGDISIEDALRVLPFRNTVDIVQLKGEDLLEVLEHSVRDYNPKALRGRFLQYSGIWITYDLAKLNGHRVVNVEVRCSECLVPRYQPLELNRSYKVLLSDYMVKGGDGYSMIAKKARKIHLLGDLDSDVFIEYIKQMSPIYPGLERRITLLNEDAVGIASRCRIYATTYVILTIMWLYIV